MVQHGLRDMGTLDGLDDKVTFKRITRATRRVVEGTQFEVEFEAVNENRTDVAIAMQITAKPMVDCINYMKTKNDEGGCYDQQQEYQITVQSVNGIAVDYTMTIASALGTSLFVAAVFAALKYRRKGADENAHHNLV